MSVSLAESAPGVGTRRPWALTQVMNARSIAIVGASKSELSELKLTGRPLKFIRSHGFTGKVFAVNPKYDELDGYPCYPSVLAIPEEVEVAVLMVAKPRVQAAIEECGRKGVRAVLVFSSGFGELGAQGRKDEGDLVALARRYGMRVLGPNAAGLVNARNSMVLSFLTAFGQSALPRGGVSFASNSGALLSTGIRLADEKGIGFSQLGSIGNEADISLSDFVRAGVADEGTEVISAFVESIKDGPGLIAAAHKAAEVRKPVVVVKIGSSERGGKVAASHTGAITGDDATISAIFSQLGITRARDLTELVDMAALFSAYPVPTVSSAAIISTGSGGAAELMADLGDRYSLELTDFEGEIKADLAKLLTPFSILVNPIDIAGVTSDLNEEPNLFRASMEYLLKREDIGIFGVIIPVLPYMTKLVEHIVDLVRKTGKPIVPIMMGGGDYPLCVEMFRRNGTPFFATADQGARGLRLFQAYAEFQARRSAKPVKVLRDGAERKSKAVELLLAHGRRYATATLHHSAEILRLYGLPLPNQSLARSAEEAASQAAGIGFPVVMKVESPKILHKTEIGGVRIGVNSQVEARHAFAELIAAAEKVANPPDVDGILIQPMIPFQSEVILGSTRDRTFGHVMIAGMGGIWVELLKDVAARLAPVNAAEARRMISETKAEKLLAGYRGKPPADIDSVVSAIVHFSDLVADLGDYIDEIEINPIFALEAGKGAVVSDALITLSEKGRGGG
jgi:acetate---CoA ligase (ADP-forming)